MTIWQDYSGAVLMPKDKPIRTTLYLDPGLWKQIKIEAIKRGETATSLVNLALRYWLFNEK
jgi:hypothetical protein